MTYTHLDNLPDNLPALYDELLNARAEQAAPSGRGLSFVTKNIRHQVHWYLQLTVGSNRSQHYLGPDSVELRRQINSEKSLWEQAKPHIQRRQRLVRMLISGGAATVTSAEARVLEMLERVGIFVAGGVLVGTQPWSIYSNILGVSWIPQTQTTPSAQPASHQIIVGVPTKCTERKQALVDSGMGLFEVPILDNKSTSTAFRFRGQDIRVDMLTPSHGKSSTKPIYLPAAALSAAPTPFLDYLLEQAQPAVVVAKAGIMVNVPNPSRYALHGLACDSTMEGIQIIGGLLKVLLRDRAADVRKAWGAALHQPPEFVRQLDRHTQGLSPDTRENLQALVKQ
ncbi:MAG: GSU2403 family nucleotidyltransferase fold protein [Gammaproteobacteria bacterium]|nr:GSU2403 family nucleotidyltransferase fold protein [Gammaproteobacteria bacterium]